MKMWGTNDAASNGACSDSQSSPINGAVQHDHNSMSSTATASCWMSSNDENHTSRYVTSKFSSENTASLKRVMCHNTTSSEASDISVSHSDDVLSSADSVAKPPSAASLNCHSVARTSRHLYSHSVADDDGYFINNTHRNTVSASDADTARVSESVCSDCFSTNGVDVRSGLVQTSVSETVHSGDHIDHNSTCMLHDSRCAVSEQTSVGAEANNSSTTNIDLTLSSALANADLCDDGYMDDMDFAASTTMVAHQHGHSAAWFVETDACLDDFIDADMPHSATVAGSPSSSSLSSTHDETTRVSEDSRSNPSDRVTYSAVNESESDVSVNLQRESHENLQQSSNTEERGTVAYSCQGLGDNDRINSLHNEHAACASLSETQLSHDGRCSESDAVMERSYHGVNTQVQSSSPASESSHDTPPASLPSPSDDYCGSAEPMAAAFFAAVADNQVFEDSTSAGLSTGVRKHSETHDRPTGAKQNQSYWLPVGPESDLPKFGCWSCVEVMNSASLSLLDGSGTAGRPRPCDVRDSGIMWRSATGDYISSDLSNPFTDESENSVASVLSARMSSSMTL